MYFRPALKIVSVLALVGFLAACEDSEERAEKHYQSGLALLEQGEEERALVEFRNVFNLNGQHREARTLYARTMREQGNETEAFRHYRLLVEQYPDEVEGRIALAELSYFLQSQDEFERFAERAIRAAPEDPRVQAIAAAVTFREGLLKKDKDLLGDALESAAKLSGDQPENPLLQQIEIAVYMETQDLDKALFALDRSLERNPDKLKFHLARLNILARLDNQAELEAQLREMIGRFGHGTIFNPETRMTLLDALIIFYADRGELDKAEAFMRDLADPDAEDPELYLRLIGQIMQTRGPEAAIAELDAAIATSENAGLYRAKRALLTFDMGDRTTAIDELQQIVTEMEPSKLQREIKVDLATRLLVTGNEVGARQLVEQVLADEPAQATALKMSAAWMIEGDNTDGAIAALRTVMDRNPEDVQAMKLMASAYTRAGNRDVARDFLSSAVETMAHAPAESREYAKFLVDDKRLIEAEQVLVASLRKNKDNNKGNSGLLSDLGRIYLGLNDLPRLRQVISELSAIGTAEAERATTALQMSLISREQGGEEAIAYLEEISKDWSNERTAKWAVIKARLQNGDAETALASAADMLAEDPQDPNLRYMMAMAQGMAGRYGEARKGLTALLEENPKAAGLWSQLIRLEIIDGHREEASRLVEEGLAANPGDPNILLIRANFLERDGDIDGAIAIYEELYEKLPNNTILANNLASLIASNREDPESLERAAAAAARLRGSDVPAFQDTWGWIAFRQGKVEDALTHLEPAAAGLPGDAQVQYHLGRAYEASGRKDEAIAQYQKAVELDADATLSGIADAKTRLETLKAE